MSIFKNKVSVEGGSCGGGQGNNTAPGDPAAFSTDEMQKELNRLEETMEKLNIDTMTKHITLTMPHPVGTNELLREILEELKEIRQRGTTRRMENED